MRVVIAFLLSIVPSLGCRAAPPLGTDVDSASAASTKPAPTEDFADLALVPWVGDAGVNTAARFQTRYSMSGHWGAPVNGRRPMTTASFALRSGLVTGELGFPVVDATPDGLRLKIFEGQTFAPADVRFEMPIEGMLSDIFVEMAHDRIAVLTWDGPKPRLTVYRQSNKSKVFQTDLDTPGRVGSPALAWHPNKALSVEWRTKSTYQRVVVDGQTGTVRHRQNLDAKLTTIILDPVAFIRTTPNPATTTPARDTGKLTFAESFLRNPRALAGNCPLKEREGRVVRAIRLDDGRIAVAEALGSEGGEGQGGISVYGPACSGVAVLNAQTAQVEGRWGHGR